MRLFRGVLDIIKIVFKSVLIYSCLYIFQVEKRYNVYGKDGERIYSAKERSQCICRFCCGPARELEFEICDNTGKSTIRMTRPFKCSGICCGICYPYCTQELTVSVNGETAGKLITNT